MAVFFWVLAAQLWLVSRAGTDVPFMDQWNIEGAWLYPRAVDHTLRLADLFQPNNEHRIAFTHALNLFLFRAAGRWDPLLQLAAGALLHAVVGALLAGLLGAGLTGARRVLVTVAVAVLMLPVPGWHNALWGFQSQVYFVILFSLLAVAGLAGARPDWRWQTAGLLGGAASLFSMGAGLATPFALAGVALLPSGEVQPPKAWRRLLPALLLAIIAAASRVEPPTQLEDLHAVSTGQFLQVLARLLAWPWSGAPALLVLVNLPLAGLLVARYRRQEWARGPAAGFILGTALWSVAVAGALALARGGGAEMAAGIPSRYVDFLALLPLANVAVLARWWECSAREQSLRWARLAIGTWVGFVSLGWMAAADRAWPTGRRPSA